jgi:hypothetical protein
MCVEKAADLVIIVMVSKLKACTTYDIGQTGPGLLALVLALALAVLTNQSI